MARRLKIAVKTWQRWMKDPDGISLGYLKCIASILGTTPGELLKGGE